jgi:pyruvate/2-oxoglutarate dehydrogenase complex dihydrolipoamide dehydrogenase (E3) component
VKDLTPDLCIIGAGAAGLSVAAGAAQLGLSVVLFEAAEMGGDCLNYGCVPSKALIAAANLVHRARNGAALGLDTTGVSVDWASVKAHVKRAIAAIEPNDSQARFEGLGVTVIRERARFADARTITSESARVRAKRFVIATGSRPVVPPIPGVSAVAHYTNETIFDLPALPSHLIVVGGGAIGLELGQAFRRLGARVTIIEAQKVLARADGDAGAIVLVQLAKEGVTILEDAKVAQIAAAGEGVSVTVQRDGVREEIAGSHILFATGRAPALDEIGLDEAAVAFDAKGVQTSDTLRSTNPRIWALGDAAGRGLFTHLAGWHASVFVRNVLFKARTKANAQAIPSVIFTDPELAQIGLTEAEARARFGIGVSVSQWGFHDNDRAQTAADTDGFCKLVLGKGGKILGATIVGADAGELIAPIALAMSSGLGVRALTSPVLPYPTRSEIVKRAAGAHFTPTLFSKTTRRLVGMLKRIP